MKNSIKTEEVLVNVSSTGKTRQEALEKCLISMRRKVDIDKDKYVVYAKPNIINIIKEEKEVYTEKFLFLFWPREKAIYKMELEIKIKVEFL
ncbi:MAG: DUF4312 family protein [Mycoplasmatales bacterium]